MHLDKLKKKCKKVGWSLSKMRGLDQLEAVRLGKYKFPRTVDVLMRPGDVVECYDGNMNHLWTGWIGALDKFLHTL